MLLAGGCQQGPPPPYPTWGRAAQAIRVESGGPFAVLAQAAQEAETRAGPLANRVTFTPDQQKAVGSALERPLAQVRSVIGRPVDFTFQPHAPTQAPPYQRGWRLIGRSLVWDVQAAVANHNLDAAISSANQATGFGFALTGGGASDASLGLSIADEARRAIAPSLGSMSPAQLDRLASGIDGALKLKPTLQAAMRNERLNMLLGVQNLQDAYRRQDEEGLKRQFGSDAREAIAYLKELHASDLRKRPAYFEGLAHEAETEASWLGTACLQPAIKREGGSPPVGGRQPWRKFAKQLFGTGRPLLAVNDATLARSRLLILTCRALAQVKRTGAAPRDLSEIPTRLRQDPYTGRPFAYRADGPDFVLYSVGADFKDDGGETDESFTAPDLALERPKE